MLRNNCPNLSRHPVQICSVISADWHDASPAIALLAVAATCLGLSVWGLTHLFTHFDISQLWHSSYQVRFLIFLSGIFGIPTALGIAYVIIVMPIAGACGFLHAVVNHNEPSLHTSSEADDKL